MDYIRMLSVALLLASACGSDGSGAAPIPESEFAAAYMDARAELSLRCCERAGARGLDPEYAVFVSRWMQAEREQPRRYDEAAAARCIAAIDASECTAQKGADPTWTEPCLRVYGPGTAGLGEPCERVSDCALSADGETTCTVGDLTRDGIAYVCKLRIVASEGEPCEVDDALRAAECAWPLLCHPTRQVCVRPAARGEACITGPEWGDTCEAGSRCDRLETATCVEPLPVGAACTSVEDCEDLRCESGLCREPLFETSGRVCVW